MVASVSAYLRVFGLVFPPSYKGSNLSRRSDGASAFVLRYGCYADERCTISGDLLAAIPCDLFDCGVVVRSIV